MLRKKEVEKAFDEVGEDLECLLRMMKKNESRIKKLEEKNAKREIEDKLKELNKEYGIKLTLGEQLKASYNLIDAYVYGEYVKYAVALDGDVIATEDTYCELLETLEVNEFETKLKANLYNLRGKKTKK